MIKKISQNFFKELSAASVNWLLANVGDKLRIETTFSVETYAVSSTTNPFLINNTDGTIGVGWVQDPQGQFADFKIGDTIKIYDKSSTVSTSFTIVDKLDDSNIQLNVVFPASGNDYLAVDFVITVANPITAVKYLYNFIENTNTDTFLSPIDGSEQTLVHNAVDASNVTPLNMSFLGPLTYQEGSATIQGVSIDPGTTDGVYRSRFKIIHYTKVTPWILEAQVENEEDDIPPADFDTLKCWKFISQIKAAYVYTDPNYLVDEIFSTTLGNSGWYNENFDTGKTNYSIDSVTYVDSGGVTVDAIGLSTSETTVTVVVKNLTDTPFSNNNTKFVLGIFKVADTEDEYLDVTKTSDGNFLFDRALQTVGSVAVNGDQYAVTDRQILKNISATYDSTSQITITFNVAMLADVVEALSELADPKYLLFLTIQKHTLATNAADLVTLKVDLSEFDIVNTDDTMIVPDYTVFIRHPEADPDTEGHDSEPTSTGNLVTNFAFPSDISGWTNPRGEFTWGGVNEAVGLNVTGYDSFYQVISGLTIGIEYTFSVTIINYISGTGVLLLDLASNITPFSANGTYLITFIATATSHTIGVGRAIGAPDTSFSIQSMPMEGLIPDPLEVYPEDEIVAVTKFYIDRDGRTDDDIVLTSVVNKIIAKNDSTGETFDLDGATVNTAFYPVVGSVQYMDAQAARSFHLPALTIRKYIELYRRTDLDGSDKYWYQLNFPFLFRWEYWAKLTGVDSSFFDTTEDNNGFNHWWFHYASGDWSIYNKVTINATKNGDVQQYTIEAPITPHDYASNADWITKSIKTYDPDTAVELYNAGAGKRYLLSDKFTLVKAVFEKNSTPANCTVIFGIEVWEQGGYYGNRIYSSRWVADSDTWFSSVDGDGKVKLTQVGDVITAEVYVDNTLIPNPESFKLTARIYDGTFGLLTDDSVQLTTDDGTFIVVD